MYQEIQPLNRDTHRHLRLREAGYAYAAAENFCPVFLDELPLLIREYFICFPNNRTDLPHVLLGFESGVNRYVADDGRWLADYVPAFIRRYPFILAQNQGGAPGGEFTLALDAMASHLDEVEGERLFTPEGGMAPVLEARVKLLQAVERQNTITREAVLEIGRVGLFKMEEMTVMAGGRKVAAISGLRQIDEERFAASALQRGPALELIYAHRFSRANLKYGILPGVVPQVAAEVAVPAVQLSFEDDFIRFD